MLRPLQRWPWLQRLKPYWPYLGAFFGIGLLALLAIWLPFTLARRATTHQIISLQASAAQAESLGRSLQATGLISQDIIRRSKAVDTFATSLSQTGTDLAPANPRSPGIIPPPLVIPGSYPARFYSAVNHTAAIQSGLRNRTRTDLAQTKKSLVRQAQVIDALSGVLSYDPVADFSKFDLKSDDTQKRLDLAQSGLTKTRDRLNDLKSSDDPTLTALIDRTNLLLAARDRLAAGGSVDDWTAAFNLAQAAIVANRNAYWSSVSDDLANRLSNDAGQLHDAVTQWQTLAAGQL